MQETNGWTQVLPRMDLTLSFSLHKQDWGFSSEAICQAIGILYINISTSLPHYNTGRRTGPTHHSHCREILTLALIVWWSFCVVNVCGWDSHWINTQDLNKYIFIHNLIQFIISNGKQQTIRKETKLGAIYIKILDFKNKVAISQDIVCIYLAAMKTTKVKCKSRETFLFADFRLWIWSSAVWNSSFIWRYRN